MSDPRDGHVGVPAAFTSATTDDPHAPLGDGASPAPSAESIAAPADPLKLCVATTVALIAWIITPPLAVAGFAAMALIAYVRARRAGLMASRCALGDTRLVLTYLTIACAAGVVGVGWRIVG